MPVLCLLCLQAQPFWLPCIADSASCRASSVSRSGALTLSPSPGYKWIRGNNTELMRALARGPMVGGLTACRGRQTHLRCQDRAAAEPPKGPRAPLPSAAATAAAQPGRRLHEPVKPTQPKLVRAYEQARRLMCAWSCPAACSVQVVYFNVEENFYFYDFGAANSAVRLAVSLSPCGCQAARQLVVLQSMQHTCKLSQLDVPYPSMLQASIEATTAARVQSTTPWWAGCRDAHDAASLTQLALHGLAPCCCLRLLTPLRLHRRCSWVTTR